MSNTRRASCPQCDRGPRDKAMATTIDERGTVSFCHRCGYTEVNNKNSERMFQEHAVRAKQTQQLEWSERAESIWRRTLPIGGTLAQKYLEYRGCALPPRDSHVRFLQATDKHPPSLCASITDVLTGRPMSLHFTRLALDGRGKAGTEHDKMLLAGHRKRGGVIRLWPDEAVTYGLAVAEGIETALAAAHVFMPVWATVDAGNLGLLAPLAGIESLTIYADHDEAGLRAAQTCARRWRDAGRNVRILTPANAGHDAADAVAA